MAAKRILTIESVDEPTTRRMLKSIYSSEIFKDFKIDHCFFLKPHQKSIDHESIFQLIQEKISKFEPNAVLIHSGAPFFENQKTFFNIIPKLKKLYPSILFGIQRRSILNSTIIDIFDNNQEILTLENLFFHIDR